MGEWGQTRLMVIIHLHKDWGTYVFSDMLFLFWCFYSEILLKCLFFVITRLWGKYGSHNIARTKLFKLIWKNNNNNILFIFCSVFSGNVLFSDTATVFCLLLLEFFIFCSSVTLSCLCEFWRNSLLRARIKQHSAI